MSQQSATIPGGDAQLRISVLAVVTPDRAAAIERILSHTRWQIKIVHSINEAMEALRSLPIHVVLCEHRLSDGTWMDILRETEDLCPRPQTIVLSASADSALWGEVLNCGAYDLLATPLEARELYAVVPMAWRQCHRNAAKMAAPAAQPNICELAHGQ
jgi:DNA-binding NtrC family response regulator